MEAENNFVARDDFTVSVSSNRLGDLGDFQDIWIASSGGVNQKFRWSGGDMGFFLNNLLNSVEDEGLDLSTYSSTLEGSNLVSYINGEVVGDQEGGTAASSASENITFSGGFVHIRDFRIWHSALTPEQVSRL